MVGRLFVSLVSWSMVLAMLCAALWLGVRG
jgi:hypothetical protein